MLLKNNPINPAATLDTFQMQNENSKCKIRVAGLVLGGQRYGNNSKVKSQNAKKLNIAVSY